VKTCAGEALNLGNCRLSNKHFKSIEFYTDIASDLWSVSGDATQLHQVLINLCVNASDAMPDGGTLSICAENLFIDGARMNLEALSVPILLLLSQILELGFRLKY